ncbi:Fanconi anemia group C protein isoform X2 [Acipenser ruthenus]|uniref:Fanconi anemia group C protein isoform X2 n=1 Tax=Acipenser ruthenus TaxID=7906 RepID=UPI002741DA34|nr:Fanconi anemia group C protein isoform X2 [Acipenser ruthenus]
MAQQSTIPAFCLEYWQNKAVEWGQATTLASQQDVCLHLQQLKDFLQEIFQKLQHMNTTAAIKTFPLVGQLLGRLCWNPCVVADESQRTLLQCLWCLYSAEPQNAIELKANDWIQSLIRHLISDSETETENNSFIQILGYTSEEYHSNVVKCMVSSLVTELRESCCNGIHMPKRFTPDRLHSLSVFCIPLVTCLEAAPLIEALLTCCESGSGETLSADFLKAVGTALLQKKIGLQETVIIGLWLRYLPSLENVTLHLIETVVSTPHFSPQEMESLINDSLLPKASARHPHIFMIVDTIFRNILLESDGYLLVQTLMQMFTRSFIQALLFGEAQDKPPLKAFFPHNPQPLLMALLKHPSDVPSQVWPQHLLCIVETLKVAVEDKDNGGSQRGLFENWFLLVHCGDWVDIAAQQLIASKAETSEALLWLLAFYHHPNNENQQRTKLLAVARKVCDHLKVLFSSTTLSLSHLQTSLDLAEANSEESGSKYMFNQLFLNFLLFSAGGQVIAKDAVHLMTHGNLLNGISAMLAGAEHRLNSYGLMDYKAHRTLKLLQEHLKRKA